jgi:hypothetical protein
MAEILLMKELLLSRILTVIWVCFDASLFGREMGTTIKILPDFKKSQKHRIYLRTKLVEAVLLEEYYREFTSADTSLFFSV